MAVPAASAESRHTRHAHGHRRGRRPFAADELLREHLRAALSRMLSFYGLEWAVGSIRKGPNWRDARSNWFMQPTHNDLRITRILSSLRLLSLEAESSALLASLEALYGEEEDCGVTGQAMQYWRATALT